MDQRPQELSDIVNRPHHTPSDSANVLRRDPWYPYAMAGFITTGVLGVGMKVYDKFTDFTVKMKEYDGNIMHALVKNMSESSDAVDFGAVDETMIVAGIVGVVGLLGYNFYKLVNR